jgi:hypothetical protein
MSRFCAVCEEEGPLGTKVSHGYAPLYIASSPEHSDVAYGCIIITWRIHVTYPRGKCVRVDTEYNGPIDSMGPEPALIPVAAGSPFGVGNVPGTLHTPGATEWSGADNQQGTRRRSAPDMAREAYPGDDTMSSEQQDTIAKQSSGGVRGHHQLFMYGMVEPVECRP